MIVLAFTWAYVRYGSTLQADALLYGITPVVVAIVAHALWRFLRQAVKGPFLALVGMVALVIYLLGSGRYRSSSVERSSCCWCVLSSTDGRTGEG
jgi:chromate transport protein ChrA